MLTYKRIPVWLALALPLLGAGAGRAWSAFAASPYYIPVVVAAMAFVVVVGPPVVFFGVAFNLAACLGPALGVLDHPHPWRLRWTSYLAFLLFPVPFASLVWVFYCFARFNKGYQFVEFVEEEGCEPENRDTKAVHPGIKGEPGGLGQAGHGALAKGARVEGRRLHCRR